MSRGEVARRLLRLLRPLAPLMALSATARVINQGLAVAVPALAAALVVAVEPGDAVGSLLLILAGLALVKGSFRYVEQFTGHAVTFRLLSELRIEAYRNIVPLAPAGLDEDRSGDLVARVVGDIDRVEPFYAHTIAPLVSGVLVPLLAAVGLALWVDPLVAAAFLPFPLLIVVSAPWLGAGRVAELSARGRELGGDTAAGLTDVAQGLREIAAFEARDTVAAWIDDLSRRTAAARRSLARVSATRSGLGDLLAGAAVVAVTATSTYLLDSNVIGASGMAAAVVAAWVGTAPARALEGIVPDLEQALAAGTRLFHLADREPPVRPAELPVTVPAEGTLVFESVTVRFPGSGSAALDGIDLEIPGGSYVAVVGPSGSGKSTLVELPLRFRDPDKGKVQVGGVDVRNADPSALSDRIMLVPQRPEIFFGSLADNLLLADSGASASDLWEALDRAALGQWARSLPEGLSTPIGELGETLSGGQRQRLAIARAFLREPEILILDEATSELDAGTERKVLAEIARERGRRTVVVVAHRLDTVTDADEILVVDRGRLVERGRHDDLVEARGLYAGLWQRHLDVMPESA
ncbi:MAG: ABC transporter ATP-binding protein/permease [Actinobacteria bacterium]|nr:ABC transporter ATP-binding protein/permease [Actinomycetota bacterium]